ncbi:MAG: hypothetical protein SOZ89_00680 [Peptoniphilaceae bacterium]|nr:hypothetical protein [Peptoniphilaceae bacterium]MDD7383238.1 hypothetical protein [Peptoniphilaceae bacterium]MDY3737616.1 hypothetical protein [Peptoniphilaceae bacterium]
MAKFFDDLFGNKDEQLNNNSLNQSFVKYYLGSSTSKEVLEIVNSLLQSEEYILSDGYFENENLRKSIEVAKKVNQVSKLLDKSEDYDGVEINEGVLKSALEDFLNTIDHYLFYSYKKDVIDLYDRVLRTPENITEYIIKEREESIKSSLESLNEEILDTDIAFKILEFEFLIDNTNQKESFDEELNSFKKEYSNYIMSYFVNKYDNTVNLNIKDIDK